MKRGRFPRPRLREAGGLFQAPREIEAWEPCSGGRLRRFYGKDSAFHLLKLLARAKINLTLDVLGKRPDGYHEVEMVMQSVALADEVQLEKAAQGISLAVEGAPLAADESNLAWRAAALFLRRFSPAGGAAIRLKKKIPMAAGLAGGSADAAAVLRGMNELFAQGLDEAELAPLAAELGSDVPFCLAGGTQLATGRGEVLRRLADVPHFFVVLAKPPVDVSTAWVYGRYDGQQEVRHPETKKMLSAIEAGNRSLICKELCNVLESVTIKEHMEIRSLKERMMQEGALAAMMSGSGPTVFALMKSEEEARRLAAKLREETAAAVFCTETQGAQAF